MFPFLNAFFRSKILLYLLSSYEKTVMERIEKRFPAEDVACFDRMLKVISDELMPEC